MPSPMELWGKAREARIADQQKRQEAGERAHEVCRQKTGEVKEPNIHCFNERYHECAAGALEFCVTTGSILCASHHKKVHVRENPGVPMPLDDFNHPSTGSQIRSALIDGTFMTWCHCGEPFYPCTSVETGGGHELRCPQGHSTTIVVTSTETQYSAEHADPNRRVAVAAS